MAFKIFKQYYVQIESSKSGNAHKSMKDFHPMFMLCSHPLALKINSEKKSQTNGEEEEECYVGDWWLQFCSENKLEDIQQSTKLVILMAILNECEQREEKIVIFSLSLNSLDVIAHFLKNAKGYEFEREYYVIHGNTSIEKRSEYCEKCNVIENKDKR